MRPGRTPALAILLAGILTTVLFPPAALSRDHGHDQQGHGAGMPWDALSGDEQSALKDYRHNWSRYSPAEQDKLRQGARRYLDLSPGQRDAVRRKQQQYRNMSPEQRQQLREKYRRQQD
jgi:hypothetical protein